MMKAIIKGVKIISEGNCDLEYEIMDEDGNTVISDTVNIRSTEQDRESIFSHIKNVLKEIKNKYVSHKESKLSDEVSNLLHEEIDLGE